MPNVGRWFALWLMTAEAPPCHHTEKDTACQPAVLKAMLKEKESLPLSVNSYVP